MLRRIRRKRGEESLTESRDPERATYPPLRRQLLATHREDDPSDADAKTLDFRLDAQAWHLYLVEAEREAKERAELWRTGLDSVLIFAALFAGIVSAFVIDVRKDLEADSEQRMLINIERLLRGQSPDDRQIRATSVAMSGLWNMSLCITLFSAMMCVSAKAWLATHVPITTVHDAREAFLRYKIDRHSERLRLREVISGVPLLVQFALFLFLIGLVFQNFNDYVALGFILLTCCALGGILYVLMTIHPWDDAILPFQHPRLRPPYVAIPRAPVSSQSPSTPSRGDGYQQRASADSLQEINRQSRPTWTKPSQNLPSPRPSIIPWTISAKPILRNRCALCESTALPSERVANLHLREVLCIPFALKGSKAGF
ncbi:hypothetical protein DFP72DRAFT_499481 [Ephemerocybe angulata]|uniref:DUF6535 domain-containing protein n=1 Tax=Ephemerocybe angulata TaxID=980116 RepID=A0A8H6M3R7_9AGAR|nr:hypothetical protein DFP72DRAFT_499481 [Tulosesus angulatus]